MRRSTFQRKMVFFQCKGGCNSLNPGFGKDLYRNDNSVKRFGPFTEPPDSENIPFPKKKSALISNATKDLPRDMREMLESEDLILTDQKGPSREQRRPATGVSRALRARV